MKARLPPALPAGDGRPLRPPFFMAKPRTIVYIDGLNFYYGAVKGTPHKWLNFEQYFRLIRQADDIIAIKYFTAEIIGPTRVNQAVFLSALETLPSVETFLGRFKVKQVKCESTHCGHQPIAQRLFDKPEEKRTDVNIAVAMVDDAYQDRCDQFVLVSGDSDLVPAVRLIRQQFPRKKILVYIPAARNSTRSGAYELRSAAHVARAIPLNLLARAQFPAQVPNGTGGFFNKPASW